MSPYTPTIGLEIHAELKTQTKMFCNSKNDADETRPNVNVCPVCMAFPGTLPVVNRQAVHQVLRVGTAMNGIIADYTEFDRKNYFYPDLPKGYQISQYQYPLVSGGMLNGVQITRIHLEEDTARSQHAGDGYSVVDFNRAGVPLMELVTEPCIHDATTASAFAKELQMLLRTLGAGDANMEKGEMRVEANISVSRDATLGTKVEVKNLNSFKSVERAIAYEVGRQIALLESNGMVVQETRGWDEQKEETFSQRVKENSEEYRYFPDPDIPKFRLSKIAAFTHEELRKSLPELPWEKRNRLTALGLSKEDVDVLLVDPIYSAIYSNELEPIADEKVRKAGINFLMSDIRGRNPSKPSLANLSGTFASAMPMYARGDLSSAGLKSVFSEILEHGGDPETIAKEKGLIQIQDTALIEKIVDDVIAENEKVAHDVKAGKEAALKFLIGQGMKRSKGSANPTELERILKQKLSS